MEPARYDLATEAGVIACVESVLGMLCSVVNSAGECPFGIVCFATRLQGEKLNTPAPLTILSVEEDPITFFGRAYQLAIKQYQAVGVASFGGTWSVDADHPRDIGPWRDHSLEQHPKAFEAMICTLEHRAFGVRNWLARITRDGATAVASPFEEQLAVERPDQGFLEMLRSVS